MDLFGYNWKNKVKKEGPLATRMRPDSLEEFVGQEEILAEGAPLRKAIDEDRLTSSLFYGPPGTGKTTLARLISYRTRAYFVQLNAISTGVAEVRRLIEEARIKWGTEGKRTILFLDEIHRFNKSQQDALLAAVEEGTLLFIGATTENPFFHLTSPLLSRIRIFVFQKLVNEEIGLLLRRALADAERGLGKTRIESDEEAFRILASRADGDARLALNALELAVNTAEPGKDGSIRLTPGMAEQAFAVRGFSYDRAGDAHHDIASALIKSIRGSDPDAALYWLACMIRGGEDPMFVARRLVISASEDIGNADPRALQVAVATFQALKLIGMPEGRIALAQCVTYLASAPKSNAAYRGVEEALDEVDRQGRGEVPPHLRGASYRGAGRLGHGKGYLYPHDYPHGYVEQEYLPPSLKGKVFYRPRSSGYEGRIKERLEGIHRAAAPSAAKNGGRAATAKKGQEDEKTHEKEKKE